MLSCSSITKNKLLSCSSITKKRVLIDVLLLSCYVCLKRFNTAKENIFLTKKYHLHYTLEGSRGVDQSVKEIKPDGVWWWWVINPLPSTVFGLFKTTLPNWELWEFGNSTGSINLVTWWEQAIYERDVFCTYTC